MVAPLPDFPFFPFPESEEERKQELQNNIQMCLDQEPSNCINVFLFAYYE